ncbi:hypothetical protein Tco_0955964 [Tanacetum coccineum]|uniref:Uncharacterized protein n=1 Tax=Tanacetum coccineum TaxID=301880 RepID=A0ABQ5E8L9_9ASTR
MDYQCTQPSEIEICRQAEEIERQRESKKKRNEFATEKEAAELEAKRKIQECLNIREKSIPQASIRSRKSRIDPTLNPHCFNAESYLIESLLNRDTLIDSSPKFDYLLEEFSGELAHADPIPPGVVDTDSEPEEEIRLAENLSYDNSSPRQDSLRHEGGTRAVFNPHSPGYKGLKTKQKRYEVSRRPRDMLSLVDPAGVRGRKFPHTTLGYKYNNASAHG